MSEDPIATLSRILGENVDHLITVFRRLDALEEAVFPENPPQLDFGVYVMVPGGYVGRAVGISATEVQVQFASNCLKRFPIEDVEPIIVQKVHS